MAKAYRIKAAPGKSNPIEKPKSGMTAPKKLMLLFTIVNRNIISTTLRGNQLPAALKKQSI